MSADLEALDDELNQMILTGKAMEAFEKFYADGVVIQENDEPPTKGKDENRAREERFFGNVEELHNVVLLGSAVGNDITFSEWMYDLTLKDKGRVKREEVAVRRWNSGKIVQERFYYKPKT